MPRLGARDGSRLGWGRVLVLSASWGIGAGAGVALGAVLTSVSGAGAPGLSGLDPGTDLTVAPWIVGGAVFVIHLAWSLIFALVRGRRSRDRVPGQGKGDQQRAEEGVGGEVGAEIPSP